MQYIKIGIRPYKDVLHLQETLHKRRAAGEIGDTLIFCEHYPVYTVGKRDSSADWISDFTTIAGDGIEIVKTDRGGRITYHGPGQLVAYFIFNIKERGLGVKEFVHKVEDVCIKALAGLGITAVRDKEYPGLWVEEKSTTSPLLGSDPPALTSGRMTPPQKYLGRGLTPKGGRGWLRKIVALGFHVSNGVTMHGIALNVDPNMEHYRHIIPCGIKERGITSMKELLGTAPPLGEIIKAFVKIISEAF